MWKETKETEQFETLGRKSGGGEEVVGGGDEMERQEKYYRDEREIGGAWSTYRWGSVVADGGR